MIMNTLHKYIYSFTRLFFVLYFSFFRSVDCLCTCLFAPSLVGWLATAVSFSSRTSERCMFILFLKESPVSPAYNFFAFRTNYTVNTVSWITILCGRNLNLIPGIQYVSMYPASMYVLPLSTTTCVEHNLQFLVVHLWEDPLFGFFLNSHNVLSLIFRKKLRVTSPN